MKEKLKVGVVGYNFAKDFRGEIYESNWFTA